MDPLRTGLTLAALALLTTVTVRALGLEQPWLQPWAVVRAVAQLALLSLILGGVITDTRWVALFLVVMVLAATWIVVRRLRLPPARAPWVALLLAVSAAAPLAVVFAIGAVEPSGRYLLALGGIVTSGAMTACTLMGRAAADSLVADHAQVEGWLALGATPRQAARPSFRRAASTALMPATDQTRVTGIVALPGAFVGALFAGSSVLDAAQFQLIVLAAILASGALAAAAWTGVFGAPRTLP